MKREIRQLGTLPPLQRDTAQIIPMSYIKGGTFVADNVVGSVLKDAIKVERVSDKMPVVDTPLRILATATNTNTNKFTITNQETGYVTAELDASTVDAVCSDFGGLKITIISANLTGVAADDICDVSIMGDSTYIVPGTILGRVKTGDYAGKYEPIGSDLSAYDVLRVCGGTIETNKSNFVSPIYNTMNNDDRFTVDVYVFGQVFESVCRSINMTDDAKARLQGIVWE